MKQAWRWFGPSDPISIAEIRQTGAAGIVSALHHVPPGEVWTVEAVESRQREIEHPNGIVSGLTWDVVESVPVSEDIKTQTGSVKEHIAAYKDTLANLAACGVTTVCYNFMPVLDWTRTNLTYALPNGGEALAFDLVDFVVFDRFILDRPSAHDDYSPDILDAARVRYAGLTDRDCHMLQKTIVAGLPGANSNWRLDEVRQRLAAYEGMSASKLRSHLVDFLSEVVPVAERLGVRLCCHPDDPPFPLMGLPRVMSSQSDYAFALCAVDSAANGATLCTGSLGVAPDFDPVAFIETLGPKIHFAHLRNTTRSSPSDGNRHSFHEAEHLLGDTDMTSVVQALLDEERHRQTQGRPDNQIPMRPDHGHVLLSDFERETQPGYPLIGRMRGLAELRGLIVGLERRPTDEHGPLN